MYNQDLNLNNVYVIKLNQPTSGITIVPTFAATLSQH